MAVVSRSERKGSTKMSTETSLDIYGGGWGGDLELGRPRAGRLHAGREKCLRKRESGNKGTCCQVDGGRARAGRIGNVC